LFTEILQKSAGFANTSFFERKNIFWDKKVINSALFNRRGLTPCELFIHRITSSPRGLLEI
jgi:hypothetical protein